ncbi:RTA1 like protein-domain-containing protein [Tricladium varicosporioides]|nr:RTA1 like protein-domain-containing protein [Hymenoscyphus varicosporioides]
MTGTCAALTTEHTQWNFCPNVGAAYAFAVFFGLTTIAHIAQAIVYRKAYSWVIIFSGLAQTLTYIFRILSILHPDSFAAYVAWFVLILVAPLFTNAYVYMALGRMLWNYVADAKIYRITAWRLGMYFVILDIVAFVVQVYGAASASGNGITRDEVLKGLHIYMAGVGIQQFFIFVFVLFAIKLHRTILSQGTLNITNSSAKSPFPLLYTIYAVLLLITIRIIFRLVEYSEGLTSKIPSHEVYQYTLDSLPMLIALVLLNVVHPGQVMRGKECDIPGRRQRKAMGSEKSAMPLSGSLSSGLP